MYTPLTWTADVVSRSLDDQPAQVITASAILAKLNMYVLKLGVTAFSANM